jgi:hypothetical protein
MTSDGRDTTQGPELALLGKQFLDLVQKGLDPERLFHEFIDGGNSWFFSVLPPLSPVVFHSKKL